MNKYVYVEVCRGNKVISSWTFDTPKEYYWCNDEPTKILENRITKQFIDEIIDFMKENEKNKFNNITIMFTDKENFLICGIVIDHMFLNRYRIRFSDVKNKGITLRLGEESDE